MMYQAIKFLRHICTMLYFRIAAGSKFLGFDSSGIGFLFPPPTEHVRCPGAGNRDDRRRNRDGGEGSGS